MLEIISGLMFGVGLAMFEWGLSQRNARLEAEKKVKRCRGYSGVTRPVPLKILCPNAPFICMET